MRLGLAAIIALVASSASAQQVDDNTSSNVPANELKAMMEAAIGHYRDPAETQFRELRFKQTKGQTNIRNEIIPNDLICGKVNAKNQYGGYEGFKGFTYFTTEKRFIPGSAGC